MNKHLFKFLISAVIFLAAVNANAQNIITTIAGTQQSPSYSGDGGMATDAQLNSPADIVFDKKGNLYIADFVNQVVRKVDTSGNITTIAGTGYGAGTAGGGRYSGENGPATAADMNGPYGLAIDAQGNIIVADGYNHLVRKINMTTGIITKFAGNGLTSGPLGDGGPATAAELNNPVGIAIDKAGNVYISDDHNNAIRKVDTFGIITTVAGNHTPGYLGDGSAATDAELNLPIGIAIDTAGNLFIADEQNNVIRKVDNAGIITTFAGTGTKGYSGDGSAATNATLDSAQRVNFDDSNNLYISDCRNNVIRKVNAAGIISTFAGNGAGIDTSVCLINIVDTTPLNSSFCVPEGVAFDFYKRPVICDRGNSVIRRIGAPPPAIIIDHSAVRTVGTNANEFAIYPNPTNTGAVTIKLSSNITEQASCAVINMLGETITTFSVTTNQPATLALHVPAGIYYLSAATAQGKWRTQIIVQ